MKVINRYWFPIRAANWLSKKLSIDSDLLQRLIKEGTERPDSLYQTIIVRRSGKKRKLHVPNDDLKQVQKRINKRILAKFPMSPDISGFSGGSIEKAIRPHLGGPAIWMCDIKDAFPSTFKERVFGVFRAHFSETVSQLLTFLTTIPSSGALPQGAPTSPRIFDLSLKLLDREFAKIAKDKKGKYTRYADNLFFSCRKNQLQDVEKEVFTWFHMAGLDVHKVKIRCLATKESTRMLGFNVIKRKIHNTRDFKKALRLSIHHVNWLLNNGKRETLDFAKAWQKLQGQMNFARTDTIPPKLLNDYLELKKRLS